MTGYGKATSLRCNRCETRPLRAEAIACTVDLLGTQFGTHLRRLHGPERTQNGLKPRHRPQLMRVGSAVNRRVVGSSPTRGAKAFGGKPSRLVSEGRSCL